MIDFVSKSINRRIRSSLELFIEKTFETVSPGVKYISNWHIGLIAEYLIACQKRQILRLIINQPPRTLKSISVSVAFPAWILGHTPHEKIVCSSYSRTLSTALSVDCRLVIMSEWYKEVFPKTIISSGENEKTKFTTTERGARFSTSSDSTVTGFGGDFLLCDDPTKAQDAISEIKRRNVLYWLTKTWASRLDDPISGVSIVNMQRLHEEDVTGYLLQNENWELLKIPLEAPITIGYRNPNNGEIYKTYEEGECLHKERYSNEYLEILKKDCFLFATQYQQEPAPEGGGIFRDEWFQYYDELPEFDRLIQSWDTAFKDKTSSDNSVCITWGIVSDRHRDCYYIIDVFCGKLQYPQLKDKFIELEELYNPTLILVEDKASGTSIVQDLRQSGNKRIVTILPNTDKVSRSSVPSSLFQSGCVYIKKGANWLQSYKHELMLFPNGAHDDQVDSTTQFLNWANKPKKKVRTAWI